MKPRHPIKTLLGSLLMLGLLGSALTALAGRWSSDRPSQDASVTRRVDGAVDVPATYRRIVESVRKAANAPHFQSGEYVSTANVEYRSGKWGRTLYLAIAADQRCTLVEQLWRSNQPDQLRGVKGRCAYEGWLLQLEADEGDTSFLYQGRYLVINGPNPDSTRHDIQLVTPDLCLYTMYGHYDVGATERLFEEYRRGRK